MAFLNHTSHIHRIDTGCVMYHVRCNLKKQQKAQNAKRKLMIHSKSTDTIREEHSHKQNEQKIYFFPSR